MQRISKKNKRVIIVTGLSVTILGLLYYNRKKIPSGSGSANPKNNKAHLDSLHPKYKDKFQRFINATIARGFVPQINSSYRDFYKQYLLNKEDKRNAPAGKSDHNYGGAIDVQFSKAGKVLGKSTDKNEWIKSGIPQLAKSMGLCWGGDFKGYLDQVHFHACDMDASKLYFVALKQFKTSDPSKIIGNRVNIA